MSKKNNIFKLLLSGITLGLAILGGHSLIKPTQKENDQTLVQEELFVDHANDALSDDLTYVAPIVLNSTVTDSENEATKNENISTKLCSNMKVQAGKNQSNQDCMRFVVAVPHLDVSVKFTRTLVYNGDKYSKCIYPSVAYTAIKAGENTIYPSSFNVDLDDDSIIDTDYNYFVCYTMSGITDDQAELQVEVEVTDLNEVLPTSYAYNTANVYGLTYTKKDIMESTNSDYDANGLRYALQSSKDTFECIFVTDPTVAKPVIQEYVNYRLTDNVIKRIAVTKIVDGLYWNCSYITSITIPAGVTSIGQMAFSSCGNLVEIHYGGTTSDWEAIEKGMNWNSCTGYYTVYCEDGVYECEHDWDRGACVICGISHDHTDCWDDSGCCSVCGYECPHPSWEDGICETCGYDCEHDSKYSYVYYANGEHKSYCSICDYFIESDDCEFDSNYTCKFCNNKCTHSFDIYGICDYCEYECPHTEFDEDYNCKVCGCACEHESFNNETYTCEACGRPCEHESFNNETYACKACGYKCQHEYWNTTYGTCSYCEYQCPHLKWDAGICEVCYYNCPHNEEDKYVSGNNGTHSSVCSICEYGEEWEDCDYYDGICTLCDYKCTHKEEDVEYCSNDDGTHSKYYSQCWKEIASKEKCTYSSDGNCKYCDFECPHDTWDSDTGKCEDCGYRCSHDEKEYSYGGDNHHDAFCEECGYRVLEDQACDFSDGECEYCGNKCKHDGDYSYYSVDTEGYHSVSCNICNSQIRVEKCTYKYGDECSLCEIPCPHNDYSYTSNNDGTHKITCAACHKEIEDSKACSYENGSCENCNAPCYHDFDENHTCTKCELVCTHEEGTNLEGNNNGTHSIICSVCEYIIDTEDCVPGEDDYCTECGYPL